MSELSHLGKLCKAMDVARQAKVGMQLSYFDVVELAGEINALKEDIAELGVARTRWVMVSERLPKESGWYLTGLVNLSGGHFTCEVYFDANLAEPRWNNDGTIDRLYCWLDRVPEVPEPPEVQE